MRVAAIDVGTNTVRLLVADIESEGFEAVERGQRITRLGEGVDFERRLSEDGTTRTADAIDAFVGRARELDADRIRVAGTSALRDSRNRDDFASIIEQRTGIRLDVLNAKDEGRLTYRGATADLPPGKSYVVCDIGGGSTELTTAYSSVSLNMGSVRLTERYMPSDPPGPDEVSAARRHIGSELEGTDDLLLSGHERLVGVAGTITTLAALIAGIETYDRDVVHGMVIAKDDIVEWARRLQKMTTAEIAALGPVEEGRADVLCAGALILKRTMIRFLFDDVLVSERDILDGLVLDLAAKR